jgi:uncharacterized membrane protein YfcA
MNDLLLLSVSGFVAGAMNALAGGGSFVSLPALIAAGVPSVEANASSTVALFPGSIASTWAYWNGMGPVCGVARRHLLAVTLVGGFLGSLLLLWTPSSNFDFLLPWLLLFATVALAFGRQAGNFLRRFLRIGLGTMLIGQFAIGIYGGYFGGAVGLMMMALWALTGEFELRNLNPPRAMLATAANTAAVFTFIIAGAVWWPPTLVMLVGGTLGSYIGARIGRSLSPRRVHAVTLSFAFLITIAFFVRAYWPVTN